MRATCVLPLGVLVVLGGHARDARADQAAREPLQLATLHEEARAADPRLRQLELEAAQTELRLENISAARLPVVTVQGLAQYQSDVPTPPPFVPGGQPLFLPPNQTYDASAGRSAALRSDDRAAARGRAGAARRSAGARPDDAVQPAPGGERRVLLGGAAAGASRRGRDHDHRAADAAAGCRSARSGGCGAAERRGVDRGAPPAAAAGRGGAAGWTPGRAGSARDARRPLPPDDEPLALPDLGGRDRAGATEPSRPRARPEYEQFTRTRERLARQRSAAVAQERPRVSAFGRVGYGRPGLNFIRDEFDSYWLAGLQVQWTPWTWGTADREREALALQQQIVAADEAAFVRGVERTVQTDLAALDRLEGRSRSTTASWRCARASIARRGCASRRVW